MPLLQHHWGGSRATGGFSPASRTFPSSPLPGAPSCMKTRMLSLGFQVQFAFLLIWVRLSAMANWYNFIIIPIQRRWNFTKSLLSHPLLMLPLPMHLFRAQLTMDPLKISTGKIWRKWCETFKSVYGLTFPYFSSLLSITPLENNYTQAASSPELCILPVQ